MTNPILDSTLRDLLDADFAASPVAASGVGLTEFDTLLDDLSADAFRRRDADAERYLGRLERIGDVAPDGELLTVDDAIDRDLATAVLRGRTILAPFEGWKRDPVTYSGPVTSGLFTLFLQRLRPEPDLVDAAVARLGQVDRAVDAGIANLDPALAHPLIVERGLNAARGATRYVRDLVWLDVEDERPSRAPARGRRRGGRRTSSAGSPTSSGSSRRRTARGSWARSATRGSSRSARSSATTPARCAPAARRSSTGSTARWPRWPSPPRATPTTSRSCARTTPGHPPTEPAMLETYAEWTAKARAFLVETGLVTLPAGETCVVVPSPVFQRPILGVASYVAPPAFSDRWKGHFFVPFAPDGDLRGGDPVPAVEQLVRLDPHHGGPRDLSGPSLASRDAQGATRRTCGGSTRRPTSARAGRCTPSASCASGASSRTRSRSSTTSTRRCSGRRGSSSTRRSTWAR